MWCVEGTFSQRVRRFERRESNEKFPVNIGIGDYVEDLSKTMVIDRCKYIFPNLVNIYSDKLSTVFYVIKLLTL